MKKFFTANFKFRSISPERLFGFLLFSTILYHIFFWLIMRYTDGSIWIYSLTPVIHKMHLFSPGKDGGYYEHFQYIVLFWCTILSSLISRYKLRHVISIPIVYFLLFIDDSLSIHDVVMYQWSIPILDNTILSQQNILRVKDFAEFSYWFMLSLIFFVISLPGFLKADSNSRYFLKRNYKYLILLAFFASFVDTLNSNIARWLSILNITNPLIEKWLPFFLYITEECGELFVIILICTWLFGITLRTEILNLKSR